MKKPLFLFLLLFIIGSVAFLLNNFRKRDCSTVVTAEERKLPRYSLSELQRHDSVQETTAYVGYECLVYDVTSSVDQFYGVGKSYHYLVGRDSTKELRIFGGQLIKKKYPVIGILEKSTQ